MQKKTKKIAPKSKKITLNKAAGGRPPYNRPYSRLL